MSTAHLYVIPASHPSEAARKMLEMKGIEYKRTDLMPVISKGVLRAVGFPGITVPALKIEGEKVQRTGEIARALDRIVPEPQLVPTDPKKRAKVEEAEAFGDEDLQGMARRMAWNGLSRDKAPLRSYSEGAKLGLPIGLAVATAGPIIAAAKRTNKATDDAVRADLAALPAALDRIDGWVADGTIGGDQPNVADLQIAGSMALMLTMDDVKPFIKDRPAGKLATGLFPDFPGTMPPVFPNEWLEPLRG